MCAPQVELFLNISSYTFSKGIRLNIKEYYIINYYYILCKIENVVKLSSIHTIISFVSNDCDREKDKITIVVELFLEVVFFSSYIIKKYYCGDMVPK